jgi:hypothetical protein
MIRLLANLIVRTGAPGARQAFAQITPRYFEEAGIGAAILLTVTGMLLHWHLPRHRMSVEERMKDGKMTEDEARRQIKFYTWCAPIATVMGVIVLVAVLLDITS